MADRGEAAESARRASTRLQVHPSGAGPAYGADIPLLAPFYVTHLIEEGSDPRFVQEQVGHEHASMTSIYTCVPEDFRTGSLRAALDRAIGPLSLDIGKEGRS